MHILPPLKLIPLPLPCRENETFKSVGEKTSSALKRTGTAFKDTSTAIKENETIKTMGYKISDAASTLKVRWKK